MSYKLADLGTPEVERASQTVTLLGAGPIDPATGQAADVITVVGFDKRGNAVRSVDPAGVRTAAEYADAWHPDLPTRSVQVVGLPGGGDDLVTTTTYERAPDPNSRGVLRPTGNVASVTDPTGATNRTFYDATLGDGHLRRRHEHDGIRRRRPARAGDRTRRATCPGATTT